MYELVHNDRIVGGITPECSIKASEVYGQFVEGALMKTEAKTAELSKCMENTFRDVNIALANELAKICTKIGVNALDVIEMANKHPRVNIHSLRTRCWRALPSYRPIFHLFKSTRICKNNKTSQRHQQLNARIRIRKR